MRPTDGVWFVVSRPWAALRAHVCEVSSTSLLLFTGVLALSVVLRVQCPGPPGSCSPVSLLCALCCLCGVLGHLAPVRRSARSVRCVTCAMSQATWLQLTSVPARWVVLLVWCPWPLGSSAAVCALDALCCARGVLGHLAPVHRYARSVLFGACALS